jgi:phosphoribosylformylglycinamidine cyclo-ligase
MARTFNCGVGMILAVSPDEAAGLITDLAAAGETAFLVGEIVAGEKGCTVFGSAEAWSARAPWEAVHVG